MALVELYIEDAKSVKTVKLYLESNGYLNKLKKIAKKDGLFLIYTNLTLLSDNVYLQQFEYGYYSPDEQPNSNDMKGIIRNYFVDLNLSLDIPLDSLSIPKKWSIYPPMVLFPMNSFNDPLWIDLFLRIDQEAFFKYVLLKLTSSSSSVLTHAALNQPIVESDIMRRPFNITPIYGDFGPDPSQSMWDHPTSSDFEQAFWCTVIQNGIFQTWAPKYTMFSRGNIKEKARVLNYDNIRSNIVIDLYCGIGYFSLSYLKAGAEQLFGWELNPWSIQGFTRALKQNKFANYKVFKPEDEFNYNIYQQLRSQGVCIFLFQENNQRVTERFSTFPENSLNISHINLGLLPSSQQSWETSQQVLLQYGKFATPIVHIHENVHIDKFDEFKQLVLTKFSGNDKCKKIDLLHLEKVKTFAPDVWHIVIDLQLEFNKTNWNSTNKIS